MKLNLEQFRERHARYYLSMVEDAVANRDWQRIGDEIEQIRHAWEWASTKSQDDALILSYIQSIYPYQDLRGLWREVTTWHNYGLEAAKRLGNRTNEGVILENMGNAYYNLGEVEQAIKCFEQAAIIVRETGGQLGFNAQERYTHYFLDYIRFHPEDRVWFASEWLQIQRAWDWVSKKSRDEKLVLSYVQTFYPYQDFHGLWREAISWGQRGLDAARAINERRIEGVILGYLGATYRSIGEAEQAVGYFEQALVIAQEIGDRYTEEILLGNLGRLYKDLRQNERAINYLEQAFNIAKEIGDRRNQSVWLDQLGNTYRILGQMERAVEYCRQALTISQEISNRRGESAVLNSLGLAYSDMGDTDKALEYYMHALNISQEAGDRPGETTTLSNLGAVLRTLGQIKVAIEYFEQALIISREIGDRSNEGFSLHNIGDLYRELGDFLQAKRYLTLAVSIFEEIGAPFAETSRQLLTELDETEKPGGKSSFAPA